MFSIGLSNNVCRKSFIPNKMQVTYVTTCKMDLITSIFNVFNFYLILWYHPIGTLSTDKVTPELFYTLLHLGISSDFLRLVENSYALAKFTY